MITIYEHNGKELFKDEESAYEIEDIRVHYAQFDKTLVTATYTVIPPEKEGDARKVVFAKKTGTKGVNPVVEVLLETPPAKLDALDLLQEFLGGPELPDPEFLVRETIRVSEALDKLLDISKRSERVVELCLRAKPVPAKSTPLGF